MFSERPSPSRRDFPGRRWLSVGLRSLHLVGVVLLGVALATRLAPTLPGLLVLLSGAVIFAIDVWCKPSHLGEIAGMTILLKLLLVLFMLLVPAYAMATFWLLLVISSLVSHAPGDFRHRRLFS
jgi:uncharacterized membrane protein HdeD (DUF308 family)